MIYEFKNLAKKCNLTELFQESRLCYDLASPPEGATETPFDISNHIETLNTEPRDHNLRANASRRFLRTQDITTSEQLEAKLAGALNLGASFDISNNTQLVTAIARLQQVLGLPERDDANGIDGIIGQNTWNALETRLSQTTTAETEVVAETETAETSLAAEVTTDLSSASTGTPDAPVTTTERAEELLTARQAIETDRLDIIQQTTREFTQAKVLEFTNNSNDRNVNMPEWFNNLSESTFDRVMTQGEITNYTRITNNMNILGMGAMDISRNNSRVRSSTPIIGPLVDALRRDRDISVNSLLLRSNIILQEPNPDTTAGASEIIAVGQTVTFDQLLVKLNELYEKLNSDTPLTEYEEANLAALETIFNAVITLKHDLENIEVQETPEHINTDYIESVDLSDSVTSAITTTGTEFNENRINNSSNSIAAIYIDIFGPIETLIASGTIEIQPNPITQENINRPRRLVLNNIPESLSAIFTTLLTEFPELISRNNDTLQNTGNGTTTNLTTHIRNLTNHRKFQEYVNRKYELLRPVSPTDAALEFIFPSTRNGLLSRQDGALLNRRYSTMYQEHLESLSPEAREQANALIERINELLATENRNERQERRLNRLRTELEAILDTPTSRTATDTRRLREITTTNFSDPAMQSYIIAESSTFDATTGSNEISADMLNSTLLTLANLGLRRALLDNSIDQELRTEVENFMATNGTIEINVTNTDTPLTPFLVNMIRIGYNFRSLENTIALELDETERAILENPTGSALLEQFTNAGYTREQAIPLVREGMSFAASYSYSESTGHTVAGGVQVPIYNFEYNAADSNWTVRVDGGSIDFGAVGNTIATPNLGFGVAINYTSDDASTTVDTGARLGIFGASASIYVREQFTERFAFGGGLGLSASWTGIINPSAHIDLTFGSFNSAVSNRISELPIFESLNIEARNNILTAAGLTTENFSPEETNREFGRLFLNIRNGQINDSEILLAIANLIPAITTAYEYSPELEEADFKITYLRYLANSVTNEGVENLRFGQGGTTVRLGWSRSGTLRDGGTLTNWIPIGITTHVPGRTTVAVQVEQSSSETTNQNEQELYLAIATEIANRLSVENPGATTDQVNVEIGNYTIVITPDGRKEIIITTTPNPTEAPTVTTPASLATSFNTPTNINNTGLFFHETTTEQAEANIDLTCTLIDASSTNPNLRNQLISLYADHASGITLTLLDDGKIGIDFGPSGNVPPPNFNITSSQVFDAMGNPQGRRNIVLSNRVATQSDIINSPFTANPITYSASNGLRQDTAELLPSETELTAMQTQLAPFLPNGEIEFATLTPEDIAAGSTLLDTITHESLAPLEEAQITAANAILENPSFQTEIRDAITLNPETDTDTYDVSKASIIVTRYATAEGIAEPTTAFIMHVLGRLNESLTQLSDVLEGEKVERVNRTIERLCNRLVTTLLSQSPYNLTIDNEDGSVREYNDAEKATILRILITESRVTEASPDLIANINSLSTEVLNLTRNSTLLTTAGVRSLTDSIGFRTVFGHLGENPDLNIIAGSRRDFDNTNPDHQLATEFLRNLIDPPIPNQEITDFELTDLQNIFDSETALRFMAISIEGNSSIIAAIYGAEGANLFNRIITATGPLEPALTESEQTMLNHFINLIRQIRNTGTDLAHVDIFTYNTDTTTEPSLLITLATTQESGTVLLLGCGNLTFLYNFDYQVTRPRTLIPPSTDLLTSSSRDQARLTELNSRVMHELGVTAAVGFDRTEPTPTPPPPPEEEEGKDPNAVAVGEEGAEPTIDDITTSL